MHVETLRRKQREARERLYQLQIAATLSGGAALVMLSWIGFDTGEWAALVPYALAALGVIVAGGAILRTESRVAAGLLLSNALLAPYVMWTTTGRPSGLLIHLVLIVVYFRGLLATLNLAELRGVEATEPVEVR